MGRDLIRLEREFDAQVGRVFRAWTTPAGLQRWAWGSIGRHVEAVVDLRVGGGFRVSTRRPDGSRWAFSGSYAEIQPDRRLAYTLERDAPMGYESPGERVVVDFSESAGRANIVFTHAGVPDPKSRAGHVEGWENTFDALAMLLAAERW
jgi:uncharacterized protein YndB with AHSA1/START domain